MTAPISSGAQTFYAELIPQVRVWLGDIDPTVASIYPDSLLLTVLQIITPILKALGYDRNHSSDQEKISPALRDFETVLWGRATAAMVQDPKAIETGIDAIKIKTLGTEYDTSARAKFLSESSNRTFAELMHLIRAMSRTMIVSTDRLDIDTLPSILIPLGFSLLALAKLFFGLFS